MCTGQQQQHGLPKKPNMLFICFPLAIDFSMAAGIALSTPMLVEAMSSFIVGASGFAYVIPLICMMPLVLPRGMTCNM